MIHEIEISTNRSRIDVELVHNYLSKKAYWAKGRSEKEVLRTMKHSLCFGMYIGKDQIGFARVVTDYTIFAWVMDVFIIEDYRGNGYSEKFMEYILHYRSLQAVKSWGLKTKDAHGLYHKFGFKPIEDPSLFMELKK